MSEQIKMISESLEETGLYARQLSLRVVCTGLVPLSVLCQKPGESVCAEELMIFYAELMMRSSV